MTTYDETSVQEQSTLVVKVDFVDEFSDPVTPTAITWTLTDKNGNVMNTLEDEAISSPASTIYIAMSGSDLSIATGETKPYTRYLLVKAVYDSTYGDSLAFKDQLKFKLDNMIGV